MVGRSFQINLRRLVWGEFKMNITGKLFAASILALSIAVPCKLKA
jgi:hypothetical protein